MKYTTLVLSFFIFFISCTSPSEQEPINVFKKNLVKEVHSYSYNYKFGAIDSSSKKKNEFKVFDSEGKSIIEEYYSLRFKDDYSVYPPKFERIPDTLFIIRKYKKIENGELLETFSRNSGEELILSNRAVFDIQGRQTELVVYDDKGNVNEKILTKYDGDQTSLIEYNQYGRIKSKTIEDKKSIKTYDKDGKLISEQILIKEKPGNKEYTIIDSSGTKKSVSNYSDTLRIQIEYDANENEMIKIKSELKNGLVMKEYFYSNGEPNTLIIKEYKYFTK
jgi:hypothetical protein